MIVDNFQTICTALGWEFDYSRRDFANLVETVDDTVHLFLDPVDERPIRRGDTGSISETEYKGRFLLLRNSDLDEQYFKGDQSKYNQYIKPLKVLLETELANELICGYDYYIDWTIKDAINVFSENMDGILVTFTIRK